MLRIKNMQIKLSEQELEIVQAAGEVGLPATTWVRKLAMDATKDILKTRDNDRYQNHMAMSYNEVDGVSIEI